MSRDENKAVLVSRHLKKHGHISQGTATLEYGYFRLSDAILRLRNEDSDLIPDGHRIKTVMKRDASGHPYGEYQLVRKAA
ncbi:helix-turn-helix domain-containing protein [Novosphingobium lindaniclasticum]|uniref:Winged helix-turn-helix domain-containing protein n=1 Tax=Novosphingobium lindaniclasticum LE124 TaxID=1096930 RepID=T0HE75_9SPHN|nr:helix-turn-helix domain-containing protein [Novosphingobium lindaniclasticum]EQB10398.1 hypothetical protein L284_17035 [Novosphingobium lindaniclasticum LE124]